MRLVIESYRPWRSWRWLRKSSPCFFSFWNPILATIRALAPIPDSERYMKFFRPHRFMTKIAIIVKTILITESEFEILLVHIFSQSELTSDSDCSQRRVFHACHSKHGSWVELNCTFEGIFESESHEKDRQLLRSYIKALQWTGYLNYPILIPLNCWITIIMHPTVNGL